MVKNIPTCNVVLQRSSRAHMEFVHFDKLKTCYGPTSKPWLSGDLKSDIAVCPIELPGVVAPESSHVTQPIVDPDLTPAKLTTESLPASQGLTFDLAPSFFEPSAPVPCVDAQNSRGPSPITDSPTDTIFCETPPRRNPHRERRRPRRYDF